MTDLDDVDHAPLKDALFDELRQELLGHDDVLGQTAAVSLQRGPLGVVHVAAVAGLAMGSSGACNSSRS